MGARLGARLRRPPGARRASARRVMPAPPGAGTPSGARKREKRCGKRLSGPGCWGSALQHRGRTGQPTRNFPPRTEPVRASHCRRSLSGCCRLLLPLLVVRGPPEVGRVLGSWSQPPSMGSHHSPGSQPVPPPCRPEPSRCGHRCHFAGLSRFPDLCPRPVPPTGQRPPASCAPPPSWVAPLPSEPPRSQ